MAAIYPREEPDALMRARPDLCGGHLVTGVPTAIANGHAEDARFVGTENCKLWRSIVAARILMLLSASIVFTLGAIHLAYTFSGSELRPRDPALQISMTQISPGITKETTMWRCWVGFNASHRMGLILFGLIFAFLVLTHSQLLFQSPFLLVVGLATLGGPLQDLFF